MRDEIVQSVQAAVRIKSVEEEPKPGMPFGEGPHQALAHCLELSAALGFRAVNVDNMAGYAEYGAGEEMVAILGHLDVVPEGGGWTYPPYAAEIHEGRIYGRGTSDDKGPVIGALYALKAIKELGLPLKRRIRVIFGLNEETGSKCMAHYLERGEEIPVSGFTPDAEYPIINGEKGIITCQYQRALEPGGSPALISISGGSAANVVPDYAEAVILMPADQIAAIKSKAEKTAGIRAEAAGDTLTVKAFGSSAHGSTPEKGLNAVSLLLLFLGELNLPGEAGAFVDFMNVQIGLDVNGRQLGIYAEDDISGPFTLNLGTIRGDRSSIAIEMNMRYPVTHSLEGFIDIFRRKMALGKMAEVYFRHKKSLYVPPDSEVVKKLQKVYEEKTGDQADLICYGGGTYAKEMPNIVAFGPIFRGRPRVEHRPDEYISIGDLLKNVQIMAAAIYALAT